MVALVLVAGLSLTQIYQRYTKKITLKTILKQPMDYIDRIGRLYDIHQLIQQEKTGNANDLAKKFHVCRRQIYNLLSELVCYGAEIDYNRAQRTYYYLNDFEITDKKLKFTIKNN